VSSPDDKPTEHPAPGEVTLYVRAPIPDPPPANSVEKLSPDGVYVTVSDQSVTAAWVASEETVNVWGADDAIR
jgi:hypothetical protein